MSTNFDGNLTYRDYVVHTFTGILFNVFLLAAIWPILPPYWWEHEINNELIWALISIPILFLEGHFILAIDRLLFIEIPSWGFRLTQRKNKKNEGETAEEQTDDDEQDPAPYRAWRKKLYDKCTVIFYLLFGKRIIGQKTIREKEIGLIVKTKKDDKKKLSKRYFILSDFFKGVGCAAWIALVFACVQHNWWCVASLGLVISLSWFRCRLYSKLYVKNRYVKKKEGDVDGVKKETDNTTTTNE